MSAWDNELPPRDPKELENENQDLKQGEDEKPTLVIDANAFIKCLDLTTLSVKYNIISSYNVISEIRDQKAREKFASLPFEIREGYCSDESMKFVEAFAKKTGDFASLSRIDMELIAVGYEFCKQNNKLEYIRNEPPKPENLDDLREKKRQQLEKLKQEQQQEEGQQQDKDNDNDEVDPLASETESEQEEEEEEQKQDQQDQEEEEDDGWVTVPKKNVPKPEVKEEEEDDQKGWINPDNLAKFMKKTQKNETDKKIGLFMMTADYAMQNVILQMGMPLLSVDNMIIRRAKRFVLECFSCKELCQDPTQKFCPTCKNHTLLKVSCSINSDGSFVLYRKKGFKVNTRGFIYSIPKAKGGRNNKDLILREDELMQGEKYYKMKKLKKQQDREFKRTMVELDAGYQFEDKNFKQRQNDGLEIGYGKKNPNHQYHIKNKRKKK